MVVVVEMAVREAVVVMSGDGSVGTGGCGGGDGGW